MAGRFQYLKHTTVIAVQLALETDGFSYRKWGGAQHCKAGDWIVDNHGDVYTVDAESFAKTYRKVRDGVYRKDTPVWAEVASAAGRIPTKEGFTEYRAGDYLVSNGPDGQDAYAIGAAAFEAQYEPVD
jgi:hypothetical protein